MLTAYLFVEHVPVHIYLMGYRGCGKTTIGRLLADRLERAWLDTDQLIIAESGREIREIFEQDGQDAFRDLESSIVARVAAEKSPSVVSLGGGAILREQNRAALANSGRCVWLRGTAETLWQRISADASSAENRPNLTERSGFAEVVAVLADREPLYRSLADFTLDTDSDSPDEIVDAILSWMKSDA